MSARVALSLGVSGHSCASPRHLGLGSGPALRFPAGWALIEHPRHGAVLFDCGYGAAARAAMRRSLRRIYRHAIHACSAAHTDAASLLRQRGLRCEDIGTVVLSHFHPDHIGGLAPFANARFVVHAAAWRQVERGGWFGLLHAQIWKELLPADFAARLHCLDQRAARPLDGDLAGFGSGWDLFDDGSVVALPLPGHARGQVGLALNTAEGERALLAADAFWRREQLQREVALPWLTRWLAVDDAAAYRDTVQRLARFQREHPQAWVIPAHCADTLARWRARHPRAVLDETAPL